MLDTIGKGHVDMNNDMGIAEGVGGAEWMGQRGGKLG